MNVVDIVRGVSVGWDMTEFDFTIQYKLGSFDITMFLMFEFCKLYQYLCSVKMNTEIKITTDYTIICLYVPELRIKLYPT